MRGRLTLRQKRHCRRSDRAVRRHPRGPAKGRSGQHEGKGGEASCAGRLVSDPKILKGTSVASQLLARKEMSPIFSSDSEKERYGEVLTSRSTENFCDELSYEYSIVNAVLAGFDYVDENKMRSTLINIGSLSFLFQQDHFWFVHNHLPRFDKNAP